MSVSFNRDISPLLNNQCFKCHGGVKEAGELNLQFHDKPLGKGESGAMAIVPVNPDKSEFKLMAMKDLKPYESETTYAEPALEWCEVNRIGR